MTTDWILSGQQIDAIDSKNDEMAIGAILALKQAKKVWTSVMSGWKGA